MHFFKCSEMAVYSYLQLFEIIKAYFLFYILKELEFDLCVCWVIHRKFSGWIFSKIERDQVKVLRPILMPLWKFYFKDFILFTCSACLVVLLWWSLQRVIYILIFLLYLIILWGNYETEHNWISLKTKIIGSVYNKLQFNNNSSLLNQSV